MNPKRVQRHANHDFGESLELNYNSGNVAPVRAASRKKDPQRESGYPCYFFFERLASWISFNALFLVLMFGLFI